MARFICKNQMSSKQEHYCDNSWSSFIMPVFAGQEPRNDLKSKDLSNSI